MHCCIVFCAIGTTVDCLVQAVFTGDYWLYLKRFWRVLKTTEEITGDYLKLLKITEWRLLKIAGDC